MDKEDRACREVKRELGDKPRRIVIAARLVRLLVTIRERIRGIDRDRPLHIAGDRVQARRRPPVTTRGVVQRARRAHERQVSARGRAHDADAVRVQPLLRGLRADDTDRALEVGPCRHVLLQSCGTRRTVLHRDDRHALLVEIAAGGRDFEAVRIVARVASARIDDLNRLRLQVLRQVPLDVRRALVRLHVGHLALRPNVLLLVAAAREIARIALHQLDFGIDFAEIAHLAHELDRPAELLHVDGTVPAVRVKVQLGGNLHPAELPVELRRAVRRMLIFSAVEEAHGTRLRIELKGRVELHVRRVAVTRIRHRKPVRQRIRHAHRKREVDVAGNVVRRIDLRVRGRQRARRQHHRKVRARRTAEDADPLGVESALLRRGSNEPHCALSVLPAGLVDGQPLRTGRAVPEPHAGDAVVEKQVFERPELRTVTRATIRAAGNEDHARAVRIRRLFGPLEIRHPVRRAVKPGLLHLLRRRGNLILLEIRNLPLRPQRLNDARQQRGGRQTQDERQIIFHTIVHLSSFTYTFHLTPNP